MSAAALLLRAVAQLGEWARKYGEHQPEWLPPAGDVRLVEDIDHFLDPAAWSANSPRHWSIVVASVDAGRVASVQVFESIGVDPQACAREVFALRPEELAGFDLVGVFESGGVKYLRDDNRTAEFGLGSMV